MNTKADNLRAEEDDRDPHFTNRSQIGRGPPALPQVTLEHFKVALFSFPNGTGLAWDAVHPRSLLRLPDEVLRAWTALLEKCEREGVWPGTVGSVTVVLLPKPEGGSAHRANPIHASGMDALPKRRC